MDSAVEDSDPEDPDLLLEATEDHRLPCPEGPGRPFTAGRFTHEAGDKLSIQTVLDSASERECLLGIALDFWRGRGS